jgi:PAS domain S-box-containing protein
VRQPSGAAGAHDARRAQLIANTVPALLAYVDGEGRYLWANEAYRRWFGVSPDSIRGRSIRDIVGDVGWPTVEPHVARALAGEEVCYETQVSYGNGHERAVRAAYFPDRDAKGHVRGFVSFVTDVSEVWNAQRALRESERMLAVVVDTTPAMIARYDAALRLVWANGHFASRFGKEPQDLVGISLRDIVGKQAFATIEPAAARVMAGEDIDVETDIPYPTLGRRTMHLVVSPTFDSGGAVDGCVAVITDNTRHRQLERERERALAELQKVDRRKDEFLAMLSHELRNPLAPILSAVEILRLSPLTAKTLATAREVIGRQVLHMRRLLDDLLDVSRVSLGKISLQRELVDLGSVLLQAVEVSRPLLAQKRQPFSLNTGGGATLVNADSARLVQVFGNLINNAAKYSEPGGAIQVDLSVDNDQAVVRVRDQGAGMAPDLLERAFDLFVQDERSLDRSQGGIGIGLTLVRNLVRLHGGTVQAFSDGPGRGCEVVVRLPRADAGQQPKAAAPVARRNSRLPIAAASRPFRILVVDDNVDAASTLAGLLSRSGHEVAIAHDGPAALATATRTRPEIMFIDIGLSGMDGYALATALRGSGFGRATLVAVTGYGRDGDADRSRACGFDHHLIKPVDLAGLRRITETVRRARSAPVGSALSRQPAPPRETRARRR